MLRILLAVAFLTAGSLPVAPLARAQQERDSFERVKAEAERFYNEGSYRRALEIYEKIDQTTLSETDARWVRFRIGDAMWRNQAATQTRDDTVYNRAREQLEKVANEYTVAVDRNDLWVAVQHSLGDFWWNRRDSRNWGQGWNHYSQVLDYWAGSRDLDRARRAFLDLVFDIVEPSWIGEYSWYRGNIYVPANILENAVEIAQTPQDLTRSQYLLAMVMRGEGGWRQQQRVDELFAKVIDAGSDLDWYDDALFFYGEWLSQQGPPERLENGSWTYRPDYRKAVEMYRRLVREFNKGETAWFDNARQRIAEITSPTLGVSVSHIFLPGSEVQFHINWRNVEAIELALHRVDLTRDLDIPSGDRATENWLEHISIDAAEKVRSWSKDTDDKGDYVPGSETVTLEEPLEAGAYLLIAAAGGKTQRELVLVSDVSIVTKAVAKQAVVYFCDAIDGSPIRGGTVSLWEMRHDSRGRWITKKQQKETDDDGLASFDLNADLSSGQIFITAKKDARQAFDASYAQQLPGEGSSYRIYAFTDRPAYRPGDTVQWKMTARLYRDSIYTTPAEQVLEYEIQDPRGAKVMEGTLTLNQFGSAWDDLEVSDAMPLGSYQAQFWTKDRKEHIGAAELFRLEEYKLPEYEVTVSTGEDDKGRPRTYQVGDRVEIEISAQYYFGAPVANADVEVVVYQRPYWHWWQPEKKYNWLYEDSNPYRWNYWGKGDQIRREQIKTGQEGKALFSFDTPLNTNQDFEYTVEARVVDSSRREIVGSDTVRVTRQKYFVHIDTEHKIYRPGETAELTFKAMDANRNGIETSGTVKIFRQEWKEIWVSPKGEEVTGRELAAEKAKHRYFPPPPPDPNMLGWRLKYRGYTDDLILEQVVKTGENGEATLAFKPETDGYYRIEWLSEKNDLYPVHTTHWFWVCSDSSHLLGYHHGGVDIIVDKDTFRAGQTAPVMISTETNNRYVLFTVEGNTLFTHRVVHVDGTVKLIHVDVKDEHIPNIWLSAAMVNNAQTHMDTEQVVVPPTDHFLDVAVTMNQPAYEPGETGSLTVKTTDVDGNPVSAEVGLTVVDESIYYIQQEIAGDPREFFFNNRQSHQVYTTTTFNHRQFIRLKKDEKGNVVQGAIARGDELDRDAGGYGGGADDWAQERKSAGEDGRYRRMEMQNASREGLADAAMPAPSSAVAGGRGGGSGGSDQLGLLSAEKSMGAPGEAAPEHEPDQQGTGNVRVRSDFRATAVWIPSVVTNEEGVATIEVPFPDSTTRWKAIGRAISAESSFGIGEATAQTRQPLIVRLQAPRFFVAGDETVVSAVINNNTDEEMSARVDVEIQGLELLRAEVEGSVPDPRNPMYSVPANGTTTIDWHVRVTDPGTARIVAKAAAGKHSDGMERTYTVYEHGIEKHLIKSGKVRGNDLLIHLDLPAARREGSTTLSVQITPSMAITMLDALPYLIDYPYGCTEQTMSRFLPSAIVKKTLEDLKVDPALAVSRMFGGMTEKYAEDHEKQKKDLAKLDDMIEKGLARIIDFQHADGGWGWWKEGESDHYMTAYVVWGLSLAKEAAVEFDESVLTRGAEYLRTELVEEERRSDMQAWMLHALAAYQHAQDDNAKTKFEDAAIANLWKSRDELSAFTKALFALAVHTYGDDEKAQVLVRNLENGVKIDETPDTSVIVRGEQTSHQGVMATAHWGADGLYWRWSDGPVETTAFVLKALLAIDPDHQLIEPVTNWIVKNRRGAQWSNTRDTAITVLALNDYLKVSGELAGDLEYELTVNGQVIARNRVTPEDLFKSPSVIEIPQRAIADGRNDIRIVRSAGASPIYFMANATFFSEEEPITAAGHEIFVRRDYYKLVPYQTLLKGYEFDRVPMKDGDSVRSGERIEVVLTIEAKNDYEYLIFEDLKPAGIEAVQVQSGTPIYAKELKLAGIERRFDPAAPQAAEDIARDRSDYTGHTQWVYQELRDRHIAMFFTHLPEGVWEVGYELRAEVPGDFHALPVMGHAMYVPEIRCNGQEIRVTVYDRE